MSETLANWKSVSNEDLRDFMARIYNKWFCKWRDLTATMTDADWQQVLDEGNAILRDTGASSAEKSIASALLYELAARRRSSVKASAEGGKAQPAA